MKDNFYMYTEGGYEYMALHRKAMVYDPQNTDNPIIHEYFDIYSSTHETLPIYHAVLKSEMKHLEGIDSPEFPISFSMVLHEINMAWVKIIHQMIFTEKAYNTFYGEYKDVIKNILLYDTPNIKETLVYRYFKTGISIFHVAAKIWIFNKYYADRGKGICTKGNTAKIVKYVLRCYEELEKVIGEDRCIVYMMDFNGVRLIDYLMAFTESIEENKLL